MKLLGFWFGGKSGAKVSQPSRPRARLVVERLEDRCLMSHGTPAVVPEPGHIAPVSAESVAVGDVNGDSVPDIITGLTTVGQGHVKVFSNGNEQLLSSFFAYQPTFGGGVRVAVGDVNSDGFDHLSFAIVAPNGNKPAFEIKDFSFGVENPTMIGSATGGAGAGKIKFNEFTIKKTSDSASPAFFKNCCVGAHYTTVTIEMRKAGGDPMNAGKPFLRFKFDTVFTTKIDWSGPGDEDPTESITFVYGKLGVKYWTQEPYLQYTFEHAIVSSYQIGGSSGVPTDSFSINFTTTTV